MPPTREESLNAISHAISRVLTPVMICMALSVWFVQSVGDPSSCRRRRAPRMIDLNTLETEPPSPSSGTEYSVLVTVIFIVSFIVIMVVMTGVIVKLYKSGRTTFIKNWLKLAVFIIYAYVGGLYVFDFCRSRCINIDWISLCLAIWNFSVTGLYAVFGSVPRVVNQAYLIVMSSLMAYIFRNLPAYAVWIILGLLVIWDLYAVLAPSGPLKKLVELARERQDELPALVYDTNPMDPGREPFSKLSSNKARQKRSNPNAAQPSSRPVTEPHPLATSPGSVPLRVEGLGLSPATPAANSDTHAANAPLSSILPITDTSVPPVVPPPPLSASTAATPAELASNTLDPSPSHTGASSKEDTSSAEGNATGARLRKRSDTRPQPPTQASRRTAGARNGKGVAPPGTEAGGGHAEATEGESANDADGTNANAEVQVGTLGTHLKLGLGDFVFYSILVAQASEHGAMTTVASFVAILAGLCSTLFLVTVFRKPLPALPLSITMGLVSYFLTRFTVLPFVNNLLPHLLFY